MKALLLSFIALALGACASAPTSNVPRLLFADALFPSSQKPQPEDIFRLDADMQDFAAGRLRWAHRVGGLNGFAEALKRELHMEYEAAHTASAAATFASRSGNCLSLVILTAAFARELGLPYNYQFVYGMDNWNREADFAFLRRHVNVRLGNLRSDGTIVDFLMPDAESRRYLRIIPERTVIAMYRNNRAAEELVNGRVATAYWWARSAVEQAPEFVTALNTLGVIYERHGNLREAEDVLRHALAQEPENLQVLGNLANVVERRGNFGEGKALRQRIAQIEPYPPFHFLDLGLAALERDDGVAALELLQRELRRMPFNDEVHFAIARAEVRVGDLDGARKHLTLAVAYSPTRDRRNAYGETLQQLNARDAN